MTKKNTQPKLKHIPMRTCVVCRDKDNKRILQRIVSTPAGIVVDPSGKMNGRGAYLCSNEKCWERAVNTDILNKALRTTLTTEDRERLLQAKP